jgi:hypothetical protein
MLDIMTPPTGHVISTLGTVVPFVEHDGEQYQLGALAMPEGGVSAMPAFSSATGFPVIPRSQWANISFKNYVVPIANQGQTNSCVGHGSWGAFSKAWLIGAATPKHFSTCSIYAELNGGHDSGAVTTYALDQLKTGGICLYSDVPEGMIYKSQFPSGAETTAKRFKVDVGWTAKTWDELISGLLYGFIPFFDLYVGDNFAKLDANGIAPAGRSRPNHCLYSDGIAMISPGVAKLDSINSWSRAFGLDGRCYLTEANFQSGNQICLIQSVAEDPQEQNIPPAVAA